MGLIGGDECMTYRLNPEPSHKVPCLLSERQASALYGLSSHWFRKKQIEGGGPPYIKLGRTVRYSATELSNFFDQHPRLKHTSEAHNPN